MANILVSLIGDQTAPNLFLMLDPDFRHIDRHIFITTELMEQKERSQHLAAAAGIGRADYEKVIVSADNLEDIQARLEALALPAGGNCYLVNLTSGTKIMSISVFAYFSQTRFLAKIFYVPVGRNVYWQIYPAAEFQEFRLGAFHNLLAYLVSYGVDRSATVLHRSLTYPAGQTRRIMAYFLDGNDRFGEAGRTFGWLAHQLRRIHRSDREADVVISGVEGLGDFLEETGLVPGRSGRLSPPEVTYIIGGWFEEWVFEMLRTHLALPAEAIAMRVNIQAMDPVDHLGNNEFDILFMYGSTLHLLECKTGLGNNYREVKKRLDESLYRMAALHKALGVTVRASLLTLSDQLSTRKGRKKKNFAERAATLGITLLDRHDLTAPPEEWVRGLVSSERSPAVLPG